MKVPPLTRGCASQSRDFMTKEGAQALGEIAAAAWRKVGRECPFEVTLTNPGNRTRDLYAPRFPTMVNGVPT